MTATLLGPKPDYKCLKCDDGGIVCGKHFRTDCPCDAPSCEDDKGIWVTMRYCPEVCFASSEVAQRVANRANDQWGQLAWDRLVKP